MRRKQPPTWGTFDNRFVRAYKTFLLDHNPLRDCKIPGLGRLQNNEMEQFRNDRDRAFCERKLAGIRVYRGSFTPKLKALDAHLVRNGKDTLFMANDMGRDVLLMLVDVDNKNGAGNAAGAAEYIARTFLNDQACIEHSTGGRGRHVYFRLRVQGMEGHRVYDVLHNLACVIKADTALDAYGITLDNVFYGLPSLWNRDGDRWLLSKRGNLLKLPYVMPHADLRPLQSLIPLDLQDLEDLAKSIPVSASTSTTNNEGHLCRTILHPTKPARKGVRPFADHPDGLRRRTACCSEVMRRTNGMCTAEDCLIEYHNHYSYTGDDPRDIKRRLQDSERLLRKFRVNFISRASGHSHPFQKDEYLPLVMELVPTEAFIWSRREILNHERLADFVSGKVQDAFYPKTDEWFARTARNVTIANFRALKRKGIVNWICTTNQYSRLLEIAIQHELLQVFDEAVSPLLAARQGAVNGKGKARMIGPGQSLVSEHAAFVSMFEAWRTRTLTPAAA